MSNISMREQILIAGEKRARIGGYHGFSFRDLASDVGIKSASIHYHFPTKTDLVQSIAERYTENAKAALTNPKDPMDAFMQVTKMFRDALKVSDKMCLCGLLGAERDTLPEPVVAQTAAYFQMLIDYLATSINGENPERKAQFIIASLEGALILSRNLNDHTIFDSIIEDLKP